MSPTTPEPPRWEDLTPDEARDLLAEAVALAPELGQALAASLAARRGELAGLSALVDSELRTRRHLDYHEAAEWYYEALPTVDLLSREVDRAPSQPLIELLERAVRHLTAVLQRADDDGLIGSLLGTVLDLHLDACTRCLPDPVKLAKWLTTYSFGDAFSPIDPVPYAAALGDKGLAVYRRAVDKHFAADPDDRWTPSRFALQRLAVIDKDPDAIVRWHHLDEPNQHSELEIASAMREIEREHEHPSDAVDVYLALVDDQLTQAGRDRYARAIALLKKASKAAARCGRSEELHTRVAELRETHRRRPAFVTMLDAAHLA